MKIALTGATGHVGRFILTGLQRAGHDVRVLSRPKYHLGDSPDLGGCDALVHCAFHHVAGRYRGGEGDDPQGFITRNLDGSVRLFEAAKAQGVAHVVFFSSRAVYGGYPAGTPLTDDMTPRPDTLYGEVKWQAEQALYGLISPGFNAASLRATGVYGPGPNHKWTELFSDFLAGAPVAPRRGTELHGDDLAAAVCILLRHQSNGAFNVSDILLDRRDLLDRFARLQGVKRDLPKGSLDPVSVMSCEKIHALGWRPSGWTGLDGALRQICADTCVGNG